MRTIGTDGHYHPVRFFISGNVVEYKRFIKGKEIGRSIALVCLPFLS